MTDRQALDARPVAGDGRRGWWLFGLTLITMAVGLTYLGVAPQHWLRGVVIVGAALAFGGLARAVTPARRAGPLAVRSKAFDVAVYWLTAALVLTSAFLVG